MKIEVIKNRFGSAILHAEDIDTELHLTVEASDIERVCLFLRDDPDFLFNYPGDLTARDTGEEIMLWYRLQSLTANRTALLQVMLPRANPSIASVTYIWPGMNWHERECFDMYGIQFAGHPDAGSAETMRILLPEDWEGHPFRKDYEPVFSGSALHGPQETN